MNNEDEQVLTPVDHVRTIIAEIYSEEQADAFANHKSIRCLEGLSPNSQRLNINRFFHNVLLRYRADNNTNVTSVIYSLLPDGELDEWLDALEMGVIPFIAGQELVF